MAPSLSSARARGASARAPYRASARAYRASARHNRRSLTPRASESSSPTTSAPAAESADPEVGTLYECTLEKPLGIRWGRGNDGRAYIKEMSAAVGNTDPNMKVGDRVVRCSASFGEDIWDAENYGQVVYAIKTRSGGIYLQLEKRGGDVTIFEFDEVDDVTRMQRAERGGGNVGSGTREVQRRNYDIAQERAQKRVELFEEALKDYQAGELEKALITWEEVLGLEPPNYIGDNMSRCTDVFRITQFNIACVYSRMNNMDASFEALEEALRVGFEDFKMVRSDPALENLRIDDRFKPLIDKYDEPLFNENVLKGFKNLFGGGN
ncbi:protein MET1 [Pycnococcus provasolii]